MGAGTREEFRLARRPEATSFSFLKKFLLEIKKHRTCFYVFNVIARPEILSRVCPT